MTQWIRRARGIFPRRAWRVITGPYWWWYNRARHSFAAALSMRRRASARQLSEMRDLHHGQRCFILGNGPSLSSTDLGLLKNEITFGMNRIYLLFDELGFQTTYYVAVNTLVIEQCTAEIKDLTIPKFIAWRGRKWLRSDPRVTFVDTDYTPPASFSRDVTGRVFEGSTVTYVALQLAYHLGFTEVILLGVDHSFTASGTPNVTVVSAGDDPDHFSTDYFGRGFRWQLPDLAASEQAYALAKSAFEQDGRRVIDATIGGKLNIFPKAEYSSLFGTPQVAGGSN